MSVLHPEEKARYVRVRVPVTNLRKRPVDAVPLNIHDDAQASQVLFHEVLLVKEEAPGWVRVEAPEQQKHTPEGWRGYPGWVRAKDVAEAEGPEGPDGVVKEAFAAVKSGPSASSGTVFPLCLGAGVSIKGEAKGFFEIALDAGRTGWVAKRAVALKTAALPGGERGRELVRAARLFLGRAYLWGGRSLPMPWSAGPLMGVDCSGLVSLAFRVLHMDVPRDAHDQWMKATPIDPAGPGAGDLIFLSGRGSPDRIDHVMLSCGRDRFIEAAETGDIVRIRTFSQKFGLDLEGLAKVDFTVGERRLFFGRIDCPGP